MEDIALWVIAGIVGFIFLILLTSSRDSSDSYDDSGSYDDYDGLPLSPPELRATFLREFDYNDFRDICFELQVDCDSLPGYEFSDRVRELIVYLQYTGRLNELIYECKRRRPYAQWGDYHPSD